MSRMKKSEPLRMQRLLIIIPHCSLRVDKCYQEAWKNDAD